MYGLLADVIVVVHVAYVLFVVLGQLLIWAGAALGWSWVRNLYFRTVHFVAIAIVATEAVMGWECPLTTWERDLRELAGQPVSEATFMGRIMHTLLFWEAESWVFDVAYLVTAGIVLGTLIMLPPRRPGRGSANQPTPLAQRQTVPANQTATTPAAQFKSVAAG